MKVNQIVSEHKKGVRAMKYTKKTKGTVPVYGPDANDAKLKPVKPVKPVSTNEAVEVKPMPGASQVSVDGKPIATTDAATAQVISQAAEKGQFTATDGSTPPTSEDGHEIGGDPGDDFINDVEAEEGIFDAPTNPQIEALKGVAEDFIKSISEKTMPLGNANSGLNVVTILEAAQKSLFNRGETIVL